MRGESSLMIDVNSELMQVLKSSTCFGIAPDSTVPECQKCDVAAQCKAKYENGLDIPRPTAKPKKEEVKETAPKPTTTKPKTTAAKATTPTEPKPKTTKKAAAPKESNPNVPDFKPMTLEELKALAATRNVQWKDYNNDQITRMRLIMGLKSSY
jgi:hypothetical protein